MSPETFRRIVGWVVTFLMMLVATMLGAQWNIQTKHVEALQNRVTAIEIEQGKTSIELRGIKESVLRIEGTLNRFMKATYGN